MGGWGHRGGVDDDRVAFQHKPGGGIGCPGKYSGHVDCRFLVYHMYARMDSRIYYRVSGEYYLAASIRADGLSYAIISLRVAGETVSTLDQSVKCTLGSDPKTRRDAWI